MKPAHFTTYPHEYFEGDAKLAAARSHLEEYRGFSGHHFDRFASLSADRPDEFTCEDIVGVSMLSVRVPAAATLCLMDETGQIGELLTAIGLPERAIWDDEADVGEDSPAWHLWELIRAVTGIGAVTASKLLASKRPHLLPIRDDYIAWALFERTATERFDDWGAWRQYLRSPEGVDLRGTVEVVRKAVGYPAYVSALRLIDIVVWQSERARRRG